MPNYDDSKGDQSRDARLEQLLATYIAAEDAGAPCDRQLLLANHPDLAEDLDEFFDNRDQIVRVVAPLRNGIEPPNSARANPLFRRLRGSWRPSRRGGWESFSRRGRPR